MITHNTDTQFSLKDYQATHISLVKRPQRTNPFPYAWPDTLIPLLQALRNWHTVYDVFFYDPDDPMCRLPPQPSIQWLHSFVGPRRKPLTSSVLGFYCQIGANPAHENLLRVEFRGPFLPYDNEKIFIAFPQEDEPKLGISTIPEKMAFLKTLATAFGAHLGWFSTWDLSIDLPSRVGSLEPEPLNAPPFDHVPDDVLCNLVSSVNPHDIDETIAPWSGRWINFWADEILERLGRERILSLPWLHKEICPGGAVLCATDQRPDTEHPDALAAVARINQQIDFNRFHHDALLDKSNPWNGL